MWIDFILSFFSLAKGNIISDYLKMETDHKSMCRPQDQNKGKLYWLAYFKGIIHSANLVADEYLLWYSCALMKKIPYLKHKWVNLILKLFTLANLIVNQHVSMKSTLDKVRSIEIETWFENKNSNWCLIFFITFSFNKKSKFRSICGTPKACSEHSVPDLMHLIAI